MKYLAFLLLISCTQNKINNPKFNVGDCLKSITVINSNNENNEFVKEDSAVIILEYKVLAVGKKNYHLQFGKTLFTERSIERIDTKGIKINCSEIEF